MTGALMNRMLRASMMSEPAPRVNLAAAAANAGAVIRCSFYLFGALLFGVILLGINAVWGSRVQKVDARPAFYLATQYLDRLPSSSQVITGGRFGRMELIQHGAVLDRDVNLTIAMGLPPKDAILTRDSMPQLTEISALRRARMVFSSVYHDLDTRFGPARATEMRVDSDGQWKQCLSFASRFDTTAVYFVGWFCDASGAKPSPDRLACLLDKITLNKELTSKEADAFIREKMARGPMCAATPVSQTIDTRSYRTPQNPARWSQPNAQRRY
jgi:hypothetical protein